MPFSDEEKKHLSSVMEHYIKATRPDDEFRNKVDHHWRMHEQAIEVYSTHKNESGKVFETPIAKTRYIRSHDHWVIYWMRVDEKWHRYEPYPIVPTLHDFLKELDRDPYHLFWG